MVLLRMLFNDLVSYHLIFKKKVKYAWKVYFKDNKFKSSYTSYISPVSTYKKASWCHY